MPLGFHGKSLVRIRTTKNHQVRKSLKYSVLDGSAWAAMMGFTQNYMTPFALQLKATNSQISLLASIPALITSIGQLLSPNILEKSGSRKAMILPMVFLNGFMFLPIMLVPFIFKTNQVWWLLAFVTIGGVAGAIINPVWGSMMADLVPERLRGRYFGDRGMINVFVTLVFSFIASGILTHFKSTEVFVGFVIIFSAALGFRMLSLFFLSKQYEPKRIIDNDNSPSMVSLIKQVGRTNLGKFILYIVLIDFCVSISGPYFAVYMLNELKFNYIPYTLVCSASAVTNILFLHYWGKRADSAGNLKIVKITSILMPLAPILWLGNTSVVYLICVNLFSGFVWAGYSLSSVNYVYDASEPSIRHKQLAVFNSMDGLGMCIGFLLGGLIIDRLPMLLGSQYRTIFALSGIIRAGIVITLLHQLSEVRHVTRIGTWELLKFNLTSKKNRKQS